MIEEFGSTSLVESGSNYFLHPNGGSAVELSFAGAPVVDGQFGQFGGPWTPIGAEQTANGFEVAWKVDGADKYTVWSTDNSGNYLSSAFDVASGSSAALQSFETSFHQDLNGDGYIGLVLNGSSGGQTLTAGSSPTTLIGGPNDILNGGAAADTLCSSRTSVRTRSTISCRVRMSSNSANRCSPLPLKCSAMPSRSDQTS